MTRGGSQTCSAGPPSTPTARGSASPGRTTAARACGYGKRWMVEPIGGSAYRYAPGKGWAVVVDRAA
jgi:hypothetical protein